MDILDAFFVHNDGAPIRPLAHFVCVIDLAIEYDSAFINPLSLNYRGAKPKQIKENARLVLTQKEKKKQV